MSLSFIKLTGLMNRTLRIVSIVSALIAISLWLLGRSFPGGGTLLTATKRQRIIYATYLSAPAEGNNYTISEFHTSSDPYFDAARILTYQILHAPETRTQLGIEFVVFVHENVDQKKRAILREDGAQLIEFADFRLEWIRPKDRRWADIQTKLRLWQMVQFDLIVFLDADSVLTKSIDYFLDDPSVWMRRPAKPSVSFNGVEIPLPESYVLGALPQLRPNHSSHPSRVPEDYWDRHTLNAGFMIIQPCLELFHYFESLLNAEGSFDGSIAEQSILNFVFSPWGPIPWTTLDHSWNIQWPWSEDIKDGYAVLHEKWWAPMHWETRDYLLSWYWRMVGYRELSTGQIE